jgi:3-oxoacyl-[acyl-carrier protein] reductase
MIEAPHSRPAAAGLTLDLTGKRALVCGASQGIGEAVARQLASQGASVILLARSAERLGRLRGELEREGAAHPQVLALDLADHARLAEAVESEVKAGGPVHVLVNNAGGPAPGPVLEAPPEAFLAGFAAHVLAAHLLARLLIPGMKEARYGRIVNIISTSAKEPIQNLGVSNTVRGAMASWAKTLAGEVAPFGITVNNVLPGYTDTPRLRDLAERTAARRGQSVETVLAAWRAVVPVGRFARPEEIAAAAGFLASPAASYVTGIHLPVDGGRISSL